MNERSRMNINDFCIYIILCLSVFCFGCLGEGSSDTFVYTNAEDCVRFLSSDSDNFLATEEKDVGLCDLFYPVSAEFLLVRQTPTANPTDYTTRFCHSYLTFVRLLIDYSLLPQKLREPLAVTFRGKYSMLDLDNILERYGAKDTDKEISELEVKKARLLRSRILYRYAQLQELKQWYPRYCNHIKNVDAITFDSDKTAECKAYLTKNIKEYVHDEERENGFQRARDMAKYYQRNIRRHDDKNSKTPKLASFDPAYFLIMLDTMRVDPYVISPSGRKGYQMGEVRDLNFARVLLNYLSKEQQQHLGKTLHTLGNDILAIDYAGKENLADLVMNDILADGGRLELSSIIYEKALSEPKLQNKIMLNNYLCYLTSKKCDDVYKEYTSKGNAHLLYNLILNDLPLNSLDNATVEAAVQCAKDAGHVALLDAISVLVAEDTKMPVSEASAKLIKKWHADLMRVYNANDELTIVVDTMHNPRTTMYQYYDFFYHEAHERRMRNYIRGDKNRWSMMVTYVCAPSRVFGASAERELPGNYYIFISGKCSEGQKIPMVIGSHLKANQRVLSLFDKDIRSIFASLEKIDRFTRASPIEKQIFLRRELLPKLYNTAKDTPIDADVRAIISAQANACSSIEW